MLITVNSRYAVCVEDKVGTTEHSDQLARYVEVLAAEGFSDDNILPVYVQTCEQGTYAGVKKAGYSILSRRDLLDVLRTYASNDGNAIVRDFHRHLEGIDQQVEAFRTVPPSGGVALAFVARILLRVAGKALGRGVGIRAESVWRLLGILVERAQG